MKRVLFFFPMNVAREDAGSVARARSLLAYMKKRKFHVDYINSNDVWGEKLIPSDIEKLKEEGYIASHFSLSKKPSANEILTYLRFAIPRAIYRKLLRIGSKSIPDYATNYSKYLFNQILRSNSYDFIVISYAYWANLVKDNPLVKKAKLIIDTHDFLTAQEQWRKGFHTGIAFQDEMERVNLFDEIWVVSSDERYLFNQFSKRNVRLVPIIGKPFLNDNEDKTFDLIYVASDNPHNIRAAKWFFNEVYPLLKSSISICVIGKIGQVIADQANIVKYRFVADLNAYYTKARVAICPMVSGTGVKVKVIEAISHGLPVVCSVPGVDGLVNKSGNGCLIAETAESFAGRIKELLENQELYERISQEASMYFSTYHAEDVLERALDNAFYDGQDQGEN